MAQERRHYRGKANRRKVLAMADAMGAEVRARFGPDLPDWAGLGWIIGPGWNHAARRMCEAMGPEWTARARRLIRALDIASRPV